MSVSDGFYAEYRGAIEMLEKPIPFFIIQRHDERIWRANERLVRAAIQFIQTLQAEVGKRPEYLEDYVHLAAEVWYAAEPFIYAMQTYHASERVFRSLEHDSTN